MKKKKDELELSLRGYVNPHQRMMLKTILAHIDFLTEQITLLDQEVAERVISDLEDIERLDSIPGIATRMAEQILAEIGRNIENQFPSAAHLCSWAALVPGHNESAGKRKSSKGKKGNKYLKSALTEAAHSVGASKNYLGARPLTSFTSTSLQWLETNRIRISIMNQKEEDAGRHPLTVI
ncbi:hypothetical protein GCM10008018_08720 [Paenibacillus marchantiophytorum]|uniref:Transposase IS116/IS110/IS902 C-terminal domain-containing protein n=2 Tax=Paenibacillus marchantiophytorum TaxID=1619310 RepID=A0ABQ2BTP0_9BACL|nr:hypothetical protein GCM10008018_08720 [Paenibacillus marchantiophytorum]